MFDLSNLNSQQLLAVKTIDGPVLVVAGAGTGKTHVITSRIAYIVIEAGVLPNKILAITFTNKAADEMKKRINHFVPDAIFNWIGTYHSICTKILRDDIDKIGRNKIFTIIDADDQLTIIKNIIKTKNISLPAPFSAKNVRSWINQIKSILADFNELSEEITFNQIKIYDSSLIKIIKLIYDEYNHHLVINNCLDFDDLINFTYQVLKDNVQVREKWQTKFSYILVDEFQDTSYKQFMIIQYLTNPTTNNIFVVGDQNQTIYTWRGAYSGIFHDFAQWQKNYQKIELIKNYRSTPKILSVANSLIVHNGEKFGVSLSPVNQNNYDVECFIGECVNDEASFVTQKIKELKKSGIQYDKMMILYRTNSCSKSIEDNLIANGIPYTIFGGIEFYQRVEIKDLISYLKVIYKPDDLSYLRIINVPKRSIGNETIAKINQWASENNSSFINALHQIDLIDHLQDAIKNRIKSFLQFIKQLQEKMIKVKPQVAIKTIVNETKYFDYLKDEYKEYDDRYENVLELQNSINYFFTTKNNLTFVDFINEINLNMSLTKAKKLNEPCVQLMTIHLAKGKENDVVFLYNFNDGKIPNSKSLNDEQDLQEERRIAYVGLTRAINYLYLTCTNEVFAKNFFGHFKTKPSRFLKEIGQNNYKIIGKKIVSISDWQGQVFNSQQSSFQPKEMYTKTPYKFKVGDQIIHTIFGLGIVLDVNGNYLEVSFKKPHGKQTLMANHKAIKRVIN